MFVYILECKGGRLYTGVAKNVYWRINKHVQGKGAKFTRAFPPVRLRRIEGYANSKEAYAREAQIKRMSRLDKLKLTAFSGYPVTVYEINNMIERRKNDGTRKGRKPQGEKDFD